MNPKHRPRRLAAALLLALGCSPDASVDVPVGPIESTVALPVAAVPAALLDAERRIVAVSCDVATPCPAVGVGEVTVACVDGRCALGAFTLRTENQVVDLSGIEAFQAYAGVLDVVSLRRAILAFTGLKLGNAVGPLDLTWSAESDAAGASARRLATVPRTVLGSASQEVELALDSAAVTALAREVLGGTRRFRVRLAGPVEAGAGALPDAQVKLSLRMLFHIDTSP